MEIHVRIEVEGLGSKEKDNSKSVVFKLSTDTGY